MPSHWIAENGAHVLKHGKATIATVRASEARASKDHPAAIDYSIDVDPTKGIQRPNETMKLAGTVAVSDAADVAPSIKTAKAAVHGRLARFGFQRYLARSLESRAPAPKKKPAPKKPTAKPAPKKRAAPKKKA